MEVSKEYHGTATDVHDGDTFTFLSDGKSFKIRLHGIDAPEMPNQKYASESRDRLKAFLSGTIRVTKTSRVKTYGREICTILSSSGASVNISMAREGWAWALEGSHQTQDEIDLYRLAQEEAKIAKRGLWADADPMNPSAYRDSVQGPLSDQEAFTKKYSKNSADGQSDFNQKWKSRDVPITGGQGVTPTDAPPSGAPQDTTGTFGIQKKVDAIVSSTSGQFNQDLQAIKQAEMTGGLFGKGMQLAIPTIKVYLVIGIKDSSLLPGMPTQNYTLYEIDGIASASIVTHSESSPVDVATLNIMNPGARFSDSYALNQRLNRPRITPDTIRNRGTPKIPGNNELTLVAGSIIQIRMGYSNNPNELTTCFNGTIRESFGQEILTIVAEGFGRELIEKKYYVGKPETWGGIWATATSYKIISDILGREEIVNFGKYYSLISRELGFFLSNTTEDTTEPEARKLSGAGAGSEDSFPTEIGRIGRVFSAEHYKSKMFMNLYNSEINILDDEYASLRLNQLFDTGKEFGWTFTQYNASTWDTLTELTYRHPGSIVRVRPYEAGSTLFWGTKDQLYIYKDINKDLQMAAAQGDSEAAKADYDKYRHKRMKPITGYHLISSDLNIVRNGMMINGKFATKINVRWDNYANDVITGVDTNVLDIQYDDNLLPSMVRDKEITGLGITEEHTAARYGIVGLKYEMEKMYDGEIIILGNPEIRAGDIAYLDDSQKGLKGMIKIREAIHSFSPELGFVTLITPGVYIEPRKFTYSSLFPTLTMAYHKITTEAIRPAAAEATFNFEKRTLFSLMSTRNGYTQPGILSAIGSDSGIIPAGGIEGLISGIVSGTSLYGTVTLSSLLIPSSMSAVLATLGASAQVSLMGGIAQIGSGTIAGVAFGIGRSILSLGGMTLAAAFGYPGIAAVALMVIVGTAVSYSYVSLTSVTRQPLKIYPLMLNGQAYQLGITGAIFNTWADSVILDTKRGLSEIGRAMQFYSAQQGTQAGSFANWAASLAPVTMFGG
jgi:endonuclease YncB( thermonuclease family)